jgi:hypothetical protein
MQIFPNLMLGNMVKGYLYHIFAVYLEEIYIRND